MSYSKADVRTHDINLVADLNAHDPNAPEPPQGERPEPTVYDGTKAIQSTQSTFMVEDCFESEQDDVQIYWTGWWPTLHLRFVYYPVADIELVLHFTIDIIGSFSIDPETVINLLEPILQNFGRRVDGNCISCLRLDWVSPLSG